MQLKRNGNGNGHNGNGHNGNGRAGVLKVLVLVLVVIVVAVLAWRLVDRWRGPVAEVWVAAADLAPGSLVGDDDLERDQRRVKKLPAGALVRQEAIAGRLLGRRKQAGDPFVGGDFRRASEGEPAPEPALAELLPEGRVLMEVLVPLENVVTRELRRGDRLDLLATSRRNGRPQLVADDVYMLGWVDPNRLRQEQQDSEDEDAGNGDDDAESQQSLIQSLLQTSTRPAASSARGPVMTRSSNLLLALNPEDVVPLAEARANGAALTVVLHGRKEVKDGQLLTVQGQSWGVEYITGAARGNVEFVQ